jgi:hypothetical protein
MNISQTGIEPSLTGIPGAGKEVEVTAPKPNVKMPRVL